MAECCDYDENLSNFLKELNTPSCYIPEYEAYKAAHESKASKMMARNPWAIAFSSIRNIEHANRVAATTCMNTQAIAGTSYLETKEFLAACRENRLSEQSAVDINVNQNGRQNNGRSIEEVIVKPKIQTEVFFKATNAVDFFKPDNAVEFFKATKAEKYATSIRREYIEAEDYIRAFPVDGLCIKEPTHEMPEENLGVDSSALCVREKLKCGDIKDGVIKVRTGLSAPPQMDMINDQLDLQKEKMSTNIFDERIASPKTTNTMEEVVPLDLLNFCSMLGLLSSFVLIKTIFKP